MGSFYRIVSLVADSVSGERDSSIWSDGIDSEFRFLGNLEVRVVGDDLFNVVWVYIVGDWDDPVFVVEWDDQ